MQLRVLENVKGLKLGQGSLSKFLGAFVAWELVLGAFLFATHDDKLRLIDLGLIVASFPVYMVSNFLALKWFPEHGLMEGAELVAYYREKQGAFGRPDVLNALPHITNPSRPDPESLPPGHT